MNCMTYNADGSDYYMIAANLKKIFEEKYSKMVKDESDEPDISRPPTLVDKKMFSQNIYNISAEDLGRMIQILDQRCEVSVCDCLSAGVHVCRYCCRNQRFLTRLVSVASHLQACLKKIDAEDIEIDIDAIDPKTFWTVDAFVKDCLPGSAKKSGARKNKQPASGPTTDGGSKPKKAKTA
jgi:hypothetical protein